MLLCSAQLQANTPFANLPYNLGIRKEETIAEYSRAEQSTTCRLAPDLLH